MRREPTVNRYLALSIALATSLYAAAGPLCAQAPASRLPATAFVDVSVVPMDRERVVAHQTVVVRGDRIVAMGPAGKVAVPVSASRINGRGKFLIPWLADMHAHPAMLSVNIADTSQISAAERAMARRMLFFYLANGVTTIRVMGYVGKAGLEWRAQAASGAIMSPRLYVAAGPIDNVPAESVGLFVAEAKRAGFDLLKFHGVGGGEFDSAVAADRRMGLPIAGHAPGDRQGGLDRAIQALPLG